MKGRAPAAPRARATGGTFDDDDEGEVEGPAAVLLIDADSEEKPLRTSFVPCACFREGGEGGEREEEVEKKEVEFFFNASLCLLRSHRNVASFSLFFQSPLTALGGSANAGRRETSCLLSTSEEKRGQKGRRGWKEERRDERQKKRK